jgi:hypothetical protein
MPDSRRQEVLVHWRPPCPQAGFTPPSACYTGGHTPPWLGKLAATSGTRPSGKPLGRELAQLNGFLAGSHGWRSCRCGLIPVRRTHAQNRSARAYPA